MKIKKVKAREILDSRGNPTIETEVYLEDKSVGVASIASGSSTGKYEAHELRDKDPNRFNGMGVLQAVKNVNQEISPKIVGMDASYQGKLDQLLISLDGTQDKSRLGANAILSVSQAVLEASASSYKLPIYRYIQQKYGMVGKKIIMPTPSFNLINGGKHGANNLDFQEFHLVPSTRKTYSQALECGDEVYQELKKVLIYRGAIYSLGDEGGYAPRLFTNLDALEVLMEAIKNTKHEFGRDVFVGLDVAANNFYKNGKYTIRDRAQPFSEKEMVEYYQALNNQYHLFSLEDGLVEDDWEGWVQLTKILSQNTLLIGDDLLATNLQRLNKAIEKKACTGILIKPNQVGTISETINVIDVAHKADWKVIVSHRSGETNDDFIADFAVGVGADYTKFGAPARGERTVKYNRLLKIEEELKLQK
ncbi:phosphopyruvate hydratase [Candidatus Beckwithbacteria bacterium CG10_big_fil_rev_8_21_14_0_10_34_10]|uniref:Enolase n=1 Tax=Candidatus Beckwithbacteria bacterium CG10_big_fil_rev_8_21_14_0_10_34_10 TaxID=1974495 RepID=A0A2H0WCH2_9BACT|nr:MAG: phosphopyruvate hydratase [Candidatus Beckwithbacteria bacterium CG10_big_fil_rev_8_21_14_0_10_34_10]